MSKPEPYDVEDTTSNRNRLRSAAKRGDERAKATLEHLDQAKHEARWQATDDARAAAAEERRQRDLKRPSTVSAGMERLAKAREDKEAQRKKRADEIEEQAKGKRTLNGWVV